MPSEHDPREDPPLPNTVPQHPPPSSPLQLISHSIPAIFPPPLLSNFRICSSCSAPLGRALLVWNNTQPSPPTSFNIFFPNSMTSCLESGMRERKKGRRRNREQQNSRMRAFNRRMPTPSSCRVPTWFRCCGPISSLRSIYLRVC